MRIDNPLPPIEDNINQIAENIALNGVDNLEENFVDLIENENNFKANIKVIQTKDEMLGSLLDIKV